MMETCLQSDIGVACWIAKSNVKDYKHDYLQVWKKMSTVCIIH